MGQRKDKKFRRTWKSIVFIPSLSPQAVGWVKRSNPTKWSRRHNKNLFDRIYRINRIICRTAPEARPDTCNRFAEGDNRVNMPSLPQMLCPTPRRRRWLFCLSGLRPAGNILSILLILSKNLSALHSLREVLNQKQHHWGRRARLWSSLWVCGQ